MTEDTGTPDPGRFEMEAGGDFQRGSDEDRWGLLAVVGAGIIHGLEVRIEMPLAGRDGTDGSHAGPGDTILGLKCRLLDESETRPAFLLASTVRLPTGDADRGLGDDGVDVTALAVASKTFGRVTLMLNAGRVFVTDDRALDAWVANAAADYRVNATFSVVAEIVATLGAREPDAVVFRGGAILRVSERLALDAAVGAGLTRGSPDFAATAGLTLGF